MRVTGTMMVNRFLSDVMQNRKALTELQHRMSSGRQIRFPSDNPVGTLNALRLRSKIAQTERFSANIKEAEDWLVTTESAVSTALSYVMRMKELAVGGVNGAIGEAGRQAMAHEAAVIRDGLIQTGNTTHGDRYVFGGHRTLTRPFEASGAVGTHEGDITREVGDGELVKINVSGIDTIQPAILAVDSLIQALNDADIDALSTTVMESIESVIDNLTATLSELGGRMVQLSLTQERQQLIKLNSEQLLSETENADFAETVTLFKAQEYAYQAALSAGARIIQPSLLDYLR